jgi:TolB protein
VSRPSFRRWLFAVALTLASLGCKRAPEPAASAAEGSACGRLLFVETGADGRAQVRVMPAKGGAMTPLTTAPLDPEASIYPAAVSPDGRRALLLSSREIDDDGSTRDRLWLAELDRAPVVVRPLAIEIDRQLRSPSWAPDGGWLVIESATHSFRDLYRVELDSGSVLRLTDDPEGNFEPAIAPDGQRIAFVSSRDDNAEIYVMSSDGGDPRRLTNSPGDDTSPHWSPDGRTLAFVSARERKRGDDVFVMNPDGGEQRPLLGERTDSILARDLAFSPDGSQLAFTELSVKTGTAIVIVALEAGEVTARIGGDAVHQHPAWSPDGRFLAFTRSHREQSDRSDIARVRADGRELVISTDETGERWLPRWIPDPECPRVTARVAAPVGAG